MLGTNADRPVLDLPIPILGFLSGRSRSHQTPNLVWLLTFHCQEHTSQAFQLLSARGHQRELFQGTQLILQFLAL